MLKGPLPPLDGPAFEFVAAHYPRFHDGSSVRKFCVPIRPQYHSRLFPEIAFGRKLPLFPTEAFGPLLARGQERTPGNTIRKVYLCRASTQDVRAGDVLLFYMSKDERYAASQSITTVGIVQQLTSGETVDDLIRLTAKRSVYSAEDMRLMVPSANSPVRVMDFLLIGHAQVCVKLENLLAMQVFSRRPPQSIARIGEEQYARLKPHLDLGFYF